MNTTAKLLKNSGSLMLSPIGRGELELPGAGSDMSESRRRIDRGSVGSGKPIFAPQHFEQSSIPETEPQTIVESMEKGRLRIFILMCTNLQLLLSATALLSVSSNVEITPQEEAKTSIWFQVTLAQFQLIIMNTHGEEGHVDQLVFEMEDIVSSLDAQAVFTKWTLKVSNFSCRSYER